MQILPTVQSTRGTNFADAENKASLKKPEPTQAAKDTAPEEDERHHTSITISQNRQSCFNVPNVWVPCKHSRLRPQYCVSQTLSDQLIRTSETIHRLSLQILGGIVILYGIPGICSGLEGQAIPSSMQVRSIQPDQTYSATIDNPNILSFKTPFFMQLTFATLGISVSSKLFSLYLECGKAQRSQRDNTIYFVKHLSRHFDSNHDSHQTNIVSTTHATKKYQAFNILSSTCLSLGHSLLWCGLIMYQLFTGILVKPFMSGVQLPDISFPISAMMQDTCNNLTNNPLTPPATNLNPRSPDSINNYLAAQQQYMSQVVQYNTTQKMCATSFSISEIYTPDLRAQYSSSASIGMLVLGGALYLTGLHLTRILRHWHQHDALQGLLPHVHNPADVLDWDNSSAVWLRATTELCKYDMSPPQLLDVQHEIRQQFSSRRVIEMQKMQGSQNPTNTEGQKEEPLL